MWLDFKQILETIVIMLGVVLILKNWKPPISKHKQAIYCLIIGMALGIFLNFSKQGFVTGIVASSVAFWGRDFFIMLDEIREDLSNIKKDGPNNK